MDETTGWLVNARFVWVVLGVSGVAVLLHAVWRSRGVAAPDPVRESGPIV